MRVLKMASAQLSDDEIDSMIDEQWWRDWGVAKRRYTLDLLFTVAMADAGLRARLRQAEGDPARWRSLLADAVERRLVGAAGEN
jgi:hypothetical protein